MPPTSAPASADQVAVARAVPPVASTSSTIRTRSPAERVLVNLHGAAVLELVLLREGRRRQLSLLADRHEPGPVANATGAARINPRASIPATLWTGPKVAASASTTAPNRPHPRAAA